MVVENCNGPALLSWSCTNRFWHNFASNLLWKSLKIVAQDLDEAHITYTKSFRIDDAKQADPENGSMVLFLANHSFRRFFLANHISRQRSARESAGSPLTEIQKAKLPAQRVKNLNIDFQSWDVNASIYSTRSLISRAVDRSMELMTELQHCKFEGTLHPQTLELFIWKKTLRNLVLRFDSEYLRARSHDWNYETGQRIPAFNQILDLRCLVGLPHLLVLKIGRLVPKEARGLAEAVVRLRLELLVVASAPPATENDTNVSLLGTSDDESPLLTFLNRVSELRPNVKTFSGAFEGGLPETLYALGLRDLYRPVRSQKERVILDTIGNCSKLEVLELRTMAGKQLKTFLEYGDLPALRYFSVSSCRHFLTDGEWIDLGLMPSYFDLEDLTGESSIGTFKAFLYRHCSTLTQLRMSLPALSIMTSDEFCLRFIEYHLNRFWGLDKLPRAHNQLNWYNWVKWNDGEWSDRCAIEGYCYAQRIPRSITMDYLEARHR